MFNFVILSGGSGTRLWPKSRNTQPKQLLKLTNQYTMLQNTIHRILKFKCDDITRITIICNKDHVKMIDEQIKELYSVIPETISRVTIIAEPIGRDSAPAICIAALYGDSNEYTYIFPCDHIFDDDEFVRCCNESLKYLDDSIITFGIKPDKIETAYGYIKVKQNNHIERFVEKPNYEIAKTYYEQGSYLWNAGIFIFKNKNMISLFTDYAPDILENCRLTLFNTNLDEKVINLSSKLFMNCRSISIDYAIMEKACISHNDNKSIKLITIPYNSYWNDIGSFAALYDVNDKNKDNNVIKCENECDCVTLDTTNCYIDSYKLVATIGIDNIVIIDTPDALLICNKDMTQNVKKIIEQLNLKQKKE